MTRAESSLLLEKENTIRIQQANVLPFGACYFKKALEVEVFRYMVVKAL